MEIKNFNYGSKYINNSGESRELQIIGDNNSIFSLEVQRTVGSAITFYDFNTRTFVSTRKKLKNKKIVNGVFKIAVDFPATSYTSAGSGPDKYDLFLYAQNELDTFHLPYVDARLPDGTIDINSTIGSSSSLLQRVLYQYPDQTLIISALGPNETSGFTGATSAFNTFTLQSGSSTGFLPFSITVTLASSKTGVILKQPGEGDLVTFNTLAIAEPYFAIPGVNVSTENVELTIANLPRSNSNTFEISEGPTVTVGNTITGAGFDGVNDLDGPVIVTGVSGTTITLNKNVTIPAAGSNASAIAKSITYHRFKVNSASTNLSALTSGMQAYGSSIGENTLIQSYYDATTLQREITNEDGSVYEEDYTIVNHDVPAFDTLGLKPTMLNGLISTQGGVITFNSAQPTTIRNTSHKVYGYGLNDIKKISGVDLEVSDLKIELADITTTVNDTDANGVDALTTFDVASAVGIRDDVSTVHGVNLSSGVTTPVVTNISSNTITLTPGGHVLQNGQGLTFKSAGRVFTISGKIKINEMSVRSRTIYFDYERLITAS
tara:strand:- start:155 stop:1798 length:1644 start_codon:yes stop_codon:yes gene_type:complete